MALTVVSSVSLVSSSVGSDMSSVSSSMNMRMAFLDMTMVEATSTPPPIRPPAMGTSLPRLIAPFSPNLVRKRKPIF